MKSEFLSHLQSLEEEGRGIVPLSPLVRALFENTEETVKSAMRNLMTCAEGSNEENSLIHILEHWESDDGYASLWAIITLGKMHSEASISALLSVLDSEADYWKEAAMEALESIAEHHPEPILTLVSQFIEDRFAHDPFDARLFAYSAIAALAPDEDAERFLVYAFEQDDTWKGSIAHDLVHFDDLRLCEFFKRGLALAEKTNDTFLENEMREVLCTLDGDQLHIIAREEKRGKEWKDWESRWKRQLSSLGKTEEELAQKEEEESRKIMATLDDSLREAEWEKEAQGENAIRDAYPVEPFDLDAYLSLRVRNSSEEAFEEALCLLGLDANWTVEDVQREINHADMPSVVLDRLVGEMEFPSPGAFEMFSRRFMELWNLTPRESFHGLTPDEMIQAPIEEESPFIQTKSGRNEPCPCGSGKKFKKCHGS